MFKDALGDRMKKYEYVTRNYLMTRTPVIVRIDGKAFHTFTKGFVKPFDDILISSMQETMQYLCKNVQGCVLGYTQSDEISLLLIDYKKLESCSWFNYNIQKCASIAASMATMAFNNAFSYNSRKFRNDAIFDDEFDDSEVGKMKAKLAAVYEKAADKGAMFDARIFNLSKDEVTNYFLWRQNDAIRNSISMVGHCYFSDKELHKKSSITIKNMLLENHNVNWEQFPTRYKRGSCCIKVKEDNRSKWIIDPCIPVFKDDGRNYIESLIKIGV